MATRATIRGGAGAGCACGRAIALAAALLLGSGARAEEISLPAALELARTANPALAAARERAAAAAAEARAARTAAWPRLSLGDALTTTNQPAAAFAQRLDAGTLTAADLALDRLTAPAWRSHLATILSLELPVDAFGKVAIERLGAEAAARAVGATAREVELEVAAQVTTAWHRARIAGLAVAAKERALAGARAREDVLEAQAEEGATLPADQLRTRARRRRLEAELAARRGERETARAALALAVGVLGPLDPDGNWAPPVPPSRLAAWLARSEARPAVIAAGAALDRAAAAQEGEERRQRPDLLLVAQLRDDRGPLAEGRQSGAGALSLRWSLLDPQRSARRQAAASARLAAEADLAATRARVRFEIEAAWHAAAAEQERWLAARGGTEEGREALRVERERRAEGLATLTDELETEAAALAAELDEVAAAAEAAIAHALLLRAAGCTAGACPEALP